MRLPTGDWFGHARRARSSLTTATSGALSSSASVNGRPASRGMPMVLKYDGVIPVHAANGRSANGRCGPSAVWYGATTITNGGSAIVAAADTTPGADSIAGTTR